MYSLMRARLILLIIVCFSVAGCGSPDQPAANPVSSTEDSEAQLNALYAEYDEEFLALNPFYATFRGDGRFNDQWGPYDPLSDEYAAVSLAMENSYLQRLLAIDDARLGGQARLNYEIFKLERENAIERSKRGYDEFEALQPLSQFSSIPSFLVMLGSGATAQPFVTPEDYDNWIKRSGGFSRHVDVTISKLREGVERGVVRPRILIEKVLPQLAAQVVDSPEESDFWIPVKNMPGSIPATERERIEAEYRQHISDVLVPAYRKLHDYVAENYLPHTRDSIGQGEVPGGAGYYAFRVRESTTTDYTPEEIHEIGKQEAKRLFEEMKKVRDEVGFEGEMQEFFTFLKSDPQFYFDSEEAIVQAYEDLRFVINPLLDKTFDIKASADYVVKPIEAFRAQSMAAAQYFPGTPDGSRPGIFYINTYDLPSRPKYMMEALSLHEASPGHHFQLSLQQEQEDLPAFRRFGTYSAYTAYIEGWGLYAESLGKELGLYTDPYQYFGALYTDIWRANRLVVDTGMHALGWSRQEAIDWMQTNSPIAETDVVAEVERYIALPSQALAYKIGQLKIRELRNRAEQALGDNFDVRQYHNLVLTTGAVPLLVLESEVEKWIEAQRTSLTAT